MIDRIALAKIICRAAMEKAFLGLKSDGKIAQSAESAVKLALDAEIAKKWNLYLPEAIAVIKEVERQMEGRK
jgi:hypothetical protein